MIDIPESGAFISAGEVQKNSGTPVAAAGNNLIKNTDIPMVNADIMPQFPGGLKALIKYLERNIQDPEETREFKTVSVTVKFVVGYDGVLKSFEIIEDGGKKYNDEVLRVLKKMPLWIPGKTNGEKISVYYTIPVKFVAAE
ncbi:MAG: energy transducer TonB [Ferruginibacter sp.]